MKKLLFTTEMEDIEILREYYNDGFDKNDDDYYSDEAIFELECENIHNEYNSIFELNDFYDCLLIGTIGLWNGTHKSCAYISEPKELMEKCSDYDIIRFKRENNKLFVELSHHDGTHYFEIKRLNKKGTERLSNVYSGDEDYTILESIETFEKWYTTNFFNKNNKEFHIGY